MKTYLKRIVPPALIVPTKVAFRYAQQVANGSFFKLSKLDTFVSFKNLTPQIVERQIIKRGDFFEHKLNNIRLTTSKISGIVIKPNAVFSFWHLVGNPSERNGFQKSRIIRNGQVDFEVGGGVCQVSGIVYLAALKAGLKIVERHNHSVDIYEEHERIAPLGSDATVVYGSKDLQFINDSKGDIQLIFNVLHEDEIILTLFSSTKIEEIFLHFERHDEGNMRIVKTFGERQGRREEVAISVYKILKTI
jgi:vancomycin resistance protein VanW